MFKVADTDMNTYCCLTMKPPLWGTSGEYSHVIIFLETRIIGLHFAADSMGVFIQFFFLVGSVKRFFSAQE